MIRIPITPEALEAIVATLPFGTVAYELEPNANGERLTWLEEVWINKLDAIRMPGESYSDVILWLAKLEAAQRLP
jgi:hypothetical protein